MRVLDCRGKRCPIPVVELAKAWLTVEVGEVVQLLADDPAAGPDVVAWCRLRGQAFEGSPQPGTFLLRRTS